MANFSQTRVINTAQGPITVNAVFDSDINTVVFTATTDNGVTVSYTDNSQFTGINGQDRYALSNELAARGIRLSTSDASQLSLTAATLGRNATAEFRQSAVNTTGAASAGTVVSDDAAAQNNKATTINPNSAVTTPLTVDPVTGRVTSINTTPSRDQNTNPLPPLTLSSSQSTPPDRPPDVGGPRPPVPPVSLGNVTVNPSLAQNAQLEQGGNLGSAKPITTGGSPGAGAPSDDQRGGTSTQSQTNAVRNNLDELYASRSGAILTQDNVLDKYASYTYTLSWYLLTPDAFRSLTDSTKRSISGYYLLAQSGGAPVNTTGVQSQQNGIIDATGGLDTAVTDRITGAGRAPFFPLDYYIDNLEIETKYPNGGTSASHSTTSISFVLSEPYGLTLLPNLYNTVNEVFKTTGLIGANSQSNYSAALYAMVIRFYGYDQNGNLVRVRQSPANQTGSNDTSVIVEKFIPFVIENIVWSQASRLVEYKITGKIPQTDVAFSSARGTIPKNVNLTGRTVKDVLTAGATIPAVSPVQTSDASRNGQPVTPTPAPTSQSTTSPTNSELGTSILTGGSVQAGEGFPGYAFGA